MILLGSTGSIGESTLDIARRFSLDVEVLGAGRNIDLLNRQIKEFTPKIVVVQEEADRAKVAHPKVYAGEEGIFRALEESQSQTVVNAIVGYAGLSSTVKAQKLGKKVALANKESLVCAGKFIDCASIVPIDSEHFGLWYLRSDKHIKRLLITASGGAFRDVDIGAIYGASKEDALKHPNWKMGQKITIDSATMANKLFELLEARWLFDVQELDALIETQSLFHAFVDYTDGSTTAHIANADMRLPIAFALLGKVEESITKSVDFTQVGNIEFRKIDSERYPLWSAKDALLRNPESGVVFNAINEVFVGAFLEGKIPFGKIAENTLKIYERYADIKTFSLDDVLRYDAEGRAKARELL